MKGLRKRAGVQGRVMNKVVQAVTAIAIAAVAASIFTILLPSLSDRVDASAPIVVAIVAAPVPVTGKCAEQHWPYMDADCLRDGRKAEGQAKAVSRIVTPDRKMAAR